MQAALAERRDSIAKYRAVWPDGSVHWLEERGRGFYAADGTLVRMTGTSMDITERKLAEQALKRSEAQFAEAQQIAHIGSWELDLDSQQLHWSAEHYRISGMHPRDDQMGYLGGLSSVHPDDYAAARTVLEKAIDERNSYAMEMRLLRPDETVRWIHSRGTFVADPTGGAGRMVGTAQDITDRLASERQQAQLASHIDSLLSSSEELVGQLMHPKVHYQHADGTPFPRESCPLLRTMRSGVACQTDTDVVWRRDGTALAVEFTANPLVEEQEVTGVVVAFRDVSGRQRAEASLRESEQRLQLALETAGLGSWDWDIQQDRIVWSEALERMFGLDPGAFGGTSAAFQAFVDEDDLPGVGRAIADSLERDVAYRAEFRIHRIDGTEMWVGASGQVFRDPGGRPVRMLGVMRDVTDTKRADQQREIVQRSERMRSILSALHRAAPAA